MEIKYAGNTVDVELGKYVYDELSDTWIAWDILDEPTKAHLETLVREATMNMETMRAAIKNAVKVIEMVPTSSAYFA